MYSSKLLRAKDEAERLYLQRRDVLGLGHIDVGEPVYENIVGVGIGEKRINNMGQGYYCIKFYVKEKWHDCPREYLISSEILGVETDVEQIGDVSIGDVYSIRQQRIRPAPGGVSIGHYKVTAGTLGCLVIDRQRRLYILSNNHVLANLNRASSGDAILQPGPKDCGQLEQDEIGYLAKYVSIYFTAKNKVDAAIASPLEPWEEYVEQSIYEIGYIEGTVIPDIGMVVKKSGRTSGVTEGYIDAIATTLDVRMDGQTIRFIDQIVIKGEYRPFSEPGDSGAVVLNNENKVCGLLFAGSITERYSVANDIRNVEKALGVKVAC